MKRIKLLLAAFAAMVGMSVQAQTWTAPTPQGSDPVSGEKYKVMNVGAGTFLDMGKAWFSWSTTAVLSSTGVDFTLTADGDNWKFIRTGTQGVFTSGNNIAGDAMHVDNTAHTYGITKLPNGNYHIHDAGGDENSLCWGYNSSFHATGVVAHADATAEGWNCEWVFIQPANVETVANVYIAKLALYNEYLNAEAEGVSTDDAATVYNNASATVAELTAAKNALHLARVEKLAAAATDENPVDLTDLVVVNPDFSTLNGDGWTRTQTSVGNQQFGTGAMESWNNNNVSVLQELTGLPNGRYRVQCDMISGNDTKTAYVYAKGWNEVIGETVSAKSSAGNYNTMSNEVAGNTVKAEPVYVTDNKLTIGFKDPSGWVVVDNFKVFYYGYKIDGLKDLLQNQIDAVADLQGTITTSAYDVVKTYADGIVVADLNTDAAIVAASEELAEKVDAAKALQPAYAIVAKVWALYNQTDYTDANGAKAAFKAVLDPIESETTVAGLEAAVTAANLTDAVETFITTVKLDKDAFFDVTDFFVVNPTVSQNTTGWTAVENGSEKTGGSWAVCNYGECEFYQQNFKFYQNITLAKGTWEFGVTGFHRAGNHSTDFYAGDDKIRIPGVESTVVNTMAEARTYFDNGNGKVALKFALEEESNDLEIGIINSDTETDKWTIFRNFTLKYYGAVDYSIYQERWNELVEEASIDAYKNVTGTERADVDAAIADAPGVGSKKADYLAKIEVLEEAVNKLRAAAPSYDKYVTYKAESVASFGTDFSVDAPTSAEEALLAIQEINIAQYEKVADEYKFSLNGLIGDFGTWEGTATVAGEAATPNYLNWEHWSGTEHAYYEQAAAGWGNPNGWTIQYEKTCKLPAGSYVLKVAARSSAGTSSKVTCSATDAVIALPSMGNSGRGINTSGEVTWADGEIYANTGSYTDHPATEDGTGSGWQWRFLPFELTEKTEVTMTFYAEATTQYQWMSIADAELLSVNDVAAKVSYYEDNTNTIKDNDIADVSVFRSVYEGYNTVVLPFTLTANQVTEAFGTGSEVFEYSENSEDASKSVINFKKGDGSITANVPVLVKATADNGEISFKGVQIVAPEDAPVVEGKNIDFVGTYNPITVAAGDYFIYKSKLYKSEGKTNMGAFRAYLKAKEANVRAELFIDGVATSIDAIDSDNRTTGVIYNLSGQRVQKAQRGLYIVNGKKVLK